MYVSDRQPLKVKNLRILQSHKSAMIMMSSAQSLNTNTTLISLRAPPAARVEAAGA